MDGDWAIRCDKNGVHLERHDCRKKNRNLCKGSGFIEVMVQITIYISILHLSLILYNCALTLSLQLA